MKNWIKNSLTFIVLLIIYQVFISTTLRIGSMGDQQMLDTAKLLGNYLFKLIIFVVAFILVNVLLFKKEISQHDFLKKRSHFLTYYLVLTLLHAATMGNLLGKIPFYVFTVLWLSVPAMMIAYSYTKNNEQKIPLNEIITTPFFSKTKFFSPLAIMMYFLIIQAINVVTFASSNNLIITAQTFQRLLLISVCEVGSTVGALWLMTRVYSKIFLNKKEVVKKDKQTRKVKGKK